MDYLFKWMLGRVEEVFPGNEYCSYSDDQDISWFIQKRLSAKLAVLPIEDDLDDKKKWYIYCS